MADPFARPVPRIDEQLITLCSLQADTEAQLRSVRAQITSTIADMRDKVNALQQHELTLMSTYAGREARIDGLLDERLLSAQADALVK